MKEGANMSTVTRKIIEIDEEKCDGCGLCVPSCAEGAIQIVDGKARLVADRFCDGLGACLGECPQGALLVIEREAEEFDEAAVEEFLKASGKHAGHEPSSQPPSPTPAQPNMPCGCPSTQIRSFEPAAGQGHAQPPASQGCPGQQVRQVQGGGGPSALRHWPVQITLVPPTAPFLKGADLLVLADCVGPAYPRLHEDLMQGRTVLMGCPKLDDAGAYVKKFTEIFRHAGVRSVTVAMMEVPCCAGLNAIVEQAMQNAGVSIPLEQVVIGVRGERLDRPASRSA